MAAKDADLATDYADRSLYLSEVTAAMFEVELVASAQDIQNLEVFLVAGSAGDEIAPSIINVAPPTTSELNRYDAITFDAVDLQSGVRKVLIWMDSDQSDYTRMVFDGTDFLYPFQDMSSFEEIDPNTFRFILKPTGGWVYNITKLTVRVADSAGNFDGEIVI